MRRNKAKQRKGSMTIGGIEVLSVFVLGLALLGTIVTLLGKVWSARTGRGTDYTVLDDVVTLRFHDSQAQKATVVMKRKVRANWSGLSTYWCTVGTLTVPTESVQNVTIDDKPPPLLEKRLGQLRVGKHFPNALTRGEIFWIEISYELIGAFPRDREFYTYQVASRTERASIRIKFSPERRCRSAQAYGSEGGNVHPLYASDLRVAAEGEALVFVIRKPKLGQSYILVWEW